MRALSLMGAGGRTMCILYDQFHTEAALGLFLYNLAALPGEFAAMGIVQRRGSHFLHHEVEGRDERLLAVRDSHDDGAVGGRSK